MREYVISKVNEWVKELFLPSKIATFYFWTVYCGFKSGYRQKFTSIAKISQKAENEMTMSGNVLQENLGGIDVINLTFTSDMYIFNLRKLLKKLVHNIMKQRAKKQRKK